MRLCSAASSRTRNGYYSGGLENFPRLLEDWTGKTLTINGSFVALFESNDCERPMGLASDQVYKPPQRKWSFDPRLNTLAGLPPSTPELQTAFRRSWQNVRREPLNVAMESLI